MDWKLELVLLPVTDVDRAKTFYIEQLGFNLDVDHRAGDEFRVVQLTPPGSEASCNRTAASAAPVIPSGFQLRVPKSRQGSRARLTVHSDPRRRSRTQRAA